MNNEICLKYQYYSTACTISLDEIKKEASDAEKKELITKVAVPTDVCQDEVYKSGKDCTEKGCY